MLDGRARSYVEAFRLLADVVLASFGVQARVVEWPQCVRCYCERYEFHFLSRVSSISAAALEEGCRLLSVFCAQVCFGFNASTALVLRQI